MLSVGRYQLLDTLGEGGMGVVYKAFDPLIRRTVAVKLISARLAESPELRQRFFSEARAAGQLSHRNIVTIFDLGEDNGHPYFAMEYLEGRNLRMRLQSFERMSLTRKLEIMAHICEGLGYAHSKGVTHRDIKPANVFITDAGEVKILDFGLARLPASELTHSKTFIGTLNYMAPEQVAGEKTDHRTDIFAVGVVFYEMLSGRSPFEADSVAALLNKILREEPQPLGALDPAIPPQLNALVSRAMAKAREDRYQSLNELLIDLAECRTLIRDSDAGSGSWLDLDVTRELPGSTPRPPSGSSGSPPPAARATPAPAAPPSGASAAAPSGVSSAVAGRPRLRGWIVALVVIAAVAALTATATRLAWPRRAGNPAPQGSVAGVAPGQATAPHVDAPPAPTDPPPVANPPGGDAVRVLPGPGPARPKGTVGRDRSADHVSSSPPRSGAVAEPEGAVGRADAEAAQAASRGALRNADAVNAGEFAASTYQAALASNAAASELFARGEFVRAAAKAQEASDLFRRAESEARAEQARRSEPSPPPRPADATSPAPPAAPVLPPSAPRQVAPVEGVPATGGPVQPPAEVAIRELLARYADALESRDLGALKRIWPGLSGPQERALREEFGQARSIAVDLGNPTFEMANGTATVVCRRRYALVTLDGHHLESRNTSVFTVRRQGSGWVIDSVRHDAAR